MTKNPNLLGVTTVLKILVFLIGLTGIFGIAHAAFSIESWQYYRDISLPASGIVGATSALDFVKIKLPDDISRGGNNFSDIRVENQNNVEVPYLVTQNTVVHGGEADVRILDKTVSNKTVASGITTFIADTYSSGTILTGLIIDTPSINFRCQVSVYSSSQLISLDSPSWNIITDKGFIFRFSDPASGYASGKTNVDFSANTSRYFKIVIKCGEDGPVEVNSARMYGDRTIDVPSYSQPLPVTVSNDITKHTTDILIDLGSAGHITNAVTLYPTDTNYSRRVIIQSTDDPTNSSSWTFVGQSSISRISTPLFEGVSNRVTYPDQKKRYVKLSIVNDDNRPLTVGGIVLIEGSVFSAIFETRPGESYRLYYGNPDAKRPTYDISSISSYIEANKLPQASLGDEKENPSYIAPKGPVVPFTEANKGLLNSVLLIVVILLGGGIGWYLYKYTSKH